MGFYLTDENRAEAISKVIIHLGTIEFEADSYYGSILSMCESYQQYGRLTEKQEASIARLYFLKCSPEFLDTAQRVKRIRENIGNQ